MPEGLISHKPVVGKTFSLFGEMEETTSFYLKLKKFADECIEIYGSSGDLLNELRKANNNKRSLKKYLSVRDEDSFIPFVINKGRELFSSNTKEISDHLESLPLHKRFKKIFTLTEEQYHLFMLEFELTNRINKEKFLNSGYKIALLPHCIRDLNVECKAVKDEIDMYCRGCSKECYMNQVSQILREKNIKPYIWMTAKLKPIFKELYSEHSSVGVLGIACIPELVMGMRNCNKYGVPAIGIPLDANRCSRWWSEIKPGSVTLDQLKILLDS